MTQSIGSPLLWLGFLGFVLVMLALDLGVFHRRPHEVSMREAGIWSAVWVGMSALFAFGLYWMFGGAKALEFTTGYLIEKALSVDNIFVFVVIFAAFSIPASLQHRVLFWGIFGALLMRALFIGAGAALLQRFHFVMYIFGALLVATGAKLFFAKTEAEQNPADSWVYRTFRKLVPATNDLRGGKFLVREGGKWLATPLLAVLVLVEVTDVIFAVDSVPAIFAVTLDPFIVFTSNIFAILGLRSMYFLLAGVVHKFHYLKPALAIILTFVGIKLLLAGIAPIPTAVSLAVIATLVIGAVVLSLLRPRAPEAEPVPVRIDGG
ncbi:MAG: TerC family protein [Deltaproteobacteria bacterium]|nr:TerC family protein [Deltaproteobacteria bacterium]